MVSVIVPVYNGSDSLRRCLEAIAASNYARYECIVVDDGSTDDSRATSRQFATQVVELTEGPFGPAHARNCGAEAACGDILFFVDADVVIRSDTVSKVADTFARHPHVDAVFGSYDDSPDKKDFVSQYKNLSHHFVHQNGHEQAVTFWSGCGAVRRKVFLEVGGFNKDRYRCPSIEDIELGYRMRAAGHEIMVNKAIQVKHLKLWTLRGMMKADIFDRAIPWTQLILRERDLPGDLNLRLSQRVSALLLCVLLLHLGLTAFFHNTVLLPLLAGLFLLLIGYWNWTEGVPPLSRLSRRAESVIYTLMGAIGGLAVYFGIVWMLIPLGLLLAGMLAGRWLPYSGALWKQALFTSLVLASASGLGLLIVTFPVWLSVPLLLLIALIVLLNFEFYAFFARKRGPMFALAVFPFHLLYYLYSVLTFALVAGLHTWNVGVRR